MGSIALQLKPFTVPDASDTFAKALTLRDLADQRRTRELQRQALEMKLEEERRDRAEYDQFRQALGQGSTLADLAKISPARAIAWAKSQSEQQTAALTQQDKELQVEAARRKAAQERQTEILNAMASVINEPDPVKRGELDRQLKGELYNKGLISMEAALAPTPDLGVYRQYFIRIKGPDALREMDAKVAEERRKQAEADRNEANYPYEVRRKIAEAEKAEQEVTGTQPETTHQRLTREAQAQPNALGDFIRIKNDPRSTPDQRAAATASIADFLAQSKARAASGSANEDDAKDIADAIEQGLQPPDTKGLYRQGPLVRAELARRRYDQAGAIRDWQAIQRHMNTLNGQQQERLRQAVTFTYDSLDQIEDLFTRWKGAGKVTGFPLLNRLSINAAKQLPGQHGAIATALEAQINDLISELGTVYKGGNSSTDESLRLAGENLKANWNESQFKEQLSNIRRNLQLRKNSILSSQPVGVAPNSPYLPATPAPASPSSSGSGLVQWERGPDGRPRKVTK